ncbi:unnamed protein product [Tilletia controversa]|uniref:FAS1 domain-containing protein n=3 Tax=Tilletia TaxID=13289 RepID=A0A8X7SZ26_9BASI|nr:hypothetical protein CF336_g1951 [Tilletia laevis]KAE8203020.1 hypothetical protein CF328_g1877 [Tilletia controversa]KAE8263683.1 hypothetical protein A4X03_0g1500 [Tilletia caries]KAE8207290.1 hypothetical protein CF335_g1245 [Tilletia laevis]KAE8252514.1 hypothetical protein A4X06_0g2133 [Tilletia controversa]
MKFSLATAAAVLLSTAPAALAQDVNTTAYATGLLAALNANGLTALSGLAAKINTKLLPALAANIGRNLTVLAPSNAAIAALGNNLSDDDIFNVITYHILNGTFNNNQSDAVVIAPTALTASSLVSLPAGRPQVVVLAKFENGTTYVKEPLNNLTFVQSAINGVQYQNLLVRPVNQVLTVPGNLTSLATKAGLTQLAQLLTTASLLQPLENAKTGLTIFAPTNAAIEAIQSTASTLNNTQLQALLSQHVLNGSVVYSNAIGDSAVNAAGQTLSFTKNNTGVFVKLANTTAKITQTNILFRGGVVHTIDQVLVDTATNPTAANDAFSTAATAGPTPTAGGNNGSGGNGGNGGSSAAAPGSKVGAGLLALTLVASGVYVLL